MGASGEGGTYGRQGAASAGAASLRLHALAGGASQRPQAVLRKGVRVPALVGGHVVGVGGVDGVVQAVVVAARLVVAPLVVVVLLVQGALAELLLVGVELARGHPVEGARLVAVRAGRPRRLLVVGRVHGGWCRHGEGCSCENN